MYFFENIILIKEEEHIVIKYLSPIISERTSYDIIKNALESALFVLKQIEKNVSIVIYEII